MTQEDLNDLMWKNMPEWQKEQINAARNSRDAYELGYKAGVKAECEVCSVTESALAYKCADTIRNQPLDKGKI